MTGRNWKKTTVGYKWKALEALYNPVNKTTKPHLEVPTREKVRAFLLAPLTEPLSCMCRHVKVRCYMKVVSAIIRRLVEWEQ